MPFPYTFPAQLSQRKIIVNIAFFRRATEQTYWYHYHDVSDHVLSIYIRRGRQHELDRTEAGTCKIVLNNHRRIFDPFNTSGPYYNNILPMRRVRVSIANGRWLYHIFTGYIESWSQVWPHPGQGVVEIEAVDGFKLLSLARVNGTFPLNSIHGRLLQILEAAGWNDHTILDVIPRLVKTATLNNMPALSHLQELAEAECGRMFCAGDGTFVFRGRGLGTQDPPFPTFSDRPNDLLSHLPYESIVIQHDDAQLWNDITITQLNGVTDNRTDPESISKYFRRTLVRDNVPLFYESEVAILVEYLLFKYKDPFPRVREITLNPYAHPELPQAVFPREIGHKIRVIRHPTGGGTGIIDGEYLIEGIEWDITRETMRVRWQLSYAS